MSQNNTPNKAQMTEIERAACTLLSRHLDEVVSSTIHDHAENVINDPAYTERIDAQHHPNAANRKRERIDAFDYEELPEEQCDYRAMMDAAVYDLASAIVSHRQHGRTAGDREVELSDSLTITTSLAAAVVEFHEAVLNAYATLTID